MGNNHETHSWQSSGSHGVIDLNVNNSNPPRSKLPFVAPQLTRQGLLKQVTNADVSVEPN